MEKKFIDVEKLIESKNPKLLKWSPGFLINYIKRILHQEEINLIIKENWELDGLSFCKEIVERFNLNIEVKGLENVPKDGSVIMAGNHPCGGMEAIALVTVLHPIRPDVKFIVNDLLLHLHNLQEYFIGVNKHGKNSSGSLKSVNDAFASDKAIFLFPAGLVSRKTNGEVRDSDWKKTFITRSRKHDTPIIPVKIEAQELSPFFYNLSNIRKKMGVKANVEMFYLANELMNQKNSTFRITFGEPIPPEHFDSSRNDKAWAEWLKNKVYNLK